ncbi:Mobile element protein [Streptomyces lividans 1326]|uniref:Mobile element protein n=1 Tax=Streptomyces lividans 1326 TaxID=1200984 RepID=A0A7U9DZT5_STRLI|nr:Mobile element protein [Streptomyces lividans 1326]KKD17236.1 transposase [Streptomyces sp. WM6391]
MLSAWRLERRGRALNFGRPPEHDLRDIMDAILYVDRTGVQWRYLPPRLPALEHRLRLLRQMAAGRRVRPAQRPAPAAATGEGRTGRRASACVLDAQSVKTSTSVPAAGQGIDAGKKIVGRKRNIVTDTLGLLLAVLVTAASVQDSAAGARLLDQVAADHPGTRKAWGDGGYRQHLVEHAATLGIDMEITARTPGTRGFTPIPKRWAVERTYGWLMLHRRLARDYETLPTRSEAMINLAIIDLVARRLTGENTISWRDPTPQTKQ